MNYWIETCKHSIKQWYGRVQNGCTVCYKEYQEMSEYMLDNHIML